MNTAFRGELKALGTPTGETQPRALVHCTQQEIQSLKFLALGTVIVVGEAELMNTLGELQRRLAYCIENLNAAVSLAAREGIESELAKIKAQLELCAHDVRFLKNEA